MANQEPLRIRDYHTGAMSENVRIKQATVELDPENAFERILIDMVQTHRRKSADYAGTGEHVNPNQNFYDVAYQMSANAGTSVESLIAVKQARLRVLLNELWTNPEFKPNNEGIEDTLLDRAVYAVIAMTVWTEGGYHKGTSKPA